MPRITFIQADGRTETIDAATGMSLMRAAVGGNIGGIMADCGGSCSCATCHAYIDEAFLGRTGIPTEEEREMLDCAIETRPNSRLTCQVQVTDALDGMVVSVPASQI